VSNGFLLQTSVPSGNVPPAPNPGHLLTAFDVSSFGLHVDAGDHLAIVLNAQGGSDYTFSWDGAIGNPYPPGEAFERDLPNHDWINESQVVNDDYGFQTFVDPAPVPEPSSLILAGMGALGLVAYGRRRSRRAP
jgi:hypothetical protein